MKEQQITEEKPLLPEQRGPDSDTVSPPGVFNIALQLRKHESSLKPRDEWRRRIGDQAVGGYIKSTYSSPLSQATGCGQYKVLKCERAIYPGMKEMFALYDERET